jgi:hypothetical protein
MIREPSVHHDVVEKLPDAFGHVRSRAPMGIEQMDLVRLVREDEDIGVRPHVGPLIVNIVVLNQYKAVPFTMSRLEQIFKT